MEKDVERQLAELIETVLAAAVAEGPVEPLEIGAQAAAKDPALFRSIRQQLALEAVAGRARSMLRRNLGPPDGRQMDLFETNPEFPDAPVMIVVKAKYGSPMHFTRDDAEWFLMWAENRAKGIADRLKLDRKAIRDFSKMLKQARPYLVKEPAKTIGEALEARKKHLSTAASRQKREAAKKATAARWGGTKNQ
ncbi:MAG: hypothetical protein LAP40_23440 [Acidobacteriia bacterium]|nr:hypothetical protein [Terriglobia bacterium]